MPHAGTVAWKASEFTQDWCGPQIFYSITGFYQTESFLKLVLDVVISNVVYKLFKCGNSKHGNIKYGHIKYGNIKYQVKIDVDPRSCPLQQCVFSSSPTRKLFHLMKQWAG